MSEEEVDWIEDRIYELLEKLIATSKEDYAVEIRELLKVMDDHVRKSRTRISLGREPETE